LATVARTHVVTREKVHADGLIAQSGKRVVGVRRTSLEVPMHRRRIIEREMSIFGVALEPTTQRFINRERCV
jgi:hypothetical protein